MRGPARADRRGGRRCAGQPVPRRRSSDAIAEGRLAGPGNRREPLRAAIARTGSGQLEAYAENLLTGAPPNGLETMHEDGMAMARGSKRPDATCYAFGAQFVEVRAHSRTCEVRAPRAVAAFAAGTIVNPVTAHSQFQGGMIWGSAPPCTSRPRSTAARRATSTTTSPST